MTWGRCLADYTLHLGDCLEIMKDIPTGSIQAVITDPPYGLGKADWDAEFPTEWILEAARIAPRMLVMPGNTSLIKAGAALPDYKDCIVLYSKNGMTKSRIAFGNWIPVLASGDWKWEPRPNLLPFTVTTIEKIDHPSPKPIRAMLALIERYTEPGWTIFDPFMGSGTTGVACVQTGRRFIGVEIDPGYFAIAQRRIENAAAQLPLLEAAD